MFYSSELKATRALVRFISISFLILMIFSIAVGYFMLVMRYQLLEDLRQESQIESVERILNAEEGHLSDTNRDWAIWDDSWLFLMDEFPEYEESNLALDTLLTLKLNLMSYVRMDGSIKWQMEADLLEEEEIVSDDFPQDFFPESLLCCLSDEPTGGLRILGDRVFMMVAQPVKKWSEERSSAGHLVLGKELTPPVISDLAEISDIDFQVLSLPMVLEQLKPRLGKALLDDGIVIEKSQDVMTSYNKLENLTDNLHGEVVIKIVQTRTLMMLGRQTYIIYILVALSGLLIVGISVLRFMRIHYIQPFKTLYRGVQHIKEQGDLSYRIKGSSNNEFGQLYDSFNGLLDVIQEQTVELNRKNLDLHEQAVTDELTGLYNKRFYRNWLDSRAAEPLSTEHSSFSFILLDIDHFKLFNDRYGHIAGDICLRNIAGALHSVVTRNTDFCCRYGGEEFLIILEDTVCGGAIRVAEMIQQRIKYLKIPHADSPTASYVTVSLGIASTSPATSGTSPERLLELADQALYDSKNNGRNRYSVKNPEEGSCEEEE